jgi:hypothetical protein
VGAGPTLVGLHFPHKAPGNSFSGFCRERSRPVNFFPAVGFTFKQEAAVVFMGLYQPPEFGVQLFIQAAKVTHFCPQPLVTIIFYYFSVLKYCRLE